MRRAWIAGWMFLLLLAGRPVAAVPAPAKPVEDGLGCMQGLLAGLRARGRAVATLRLVRSDPLTGQRVETRGRLTLERPRFARLDLADGQRLTLREDGGDWLQPATRQLVRAGNRSASGALVWWGLMLEGGEGVIAERRTGAGEYVLVLRGSPGGPSQHVVLGPDRLPRRVDVGTEQGERLEYRFTGWRFAAPRGREAYVLEAPAGFETVRLP